MRHFRHILFFFIVLFASCGTVRRGVVPNEEVTLSVSDQRKYEYYFLEAIRLEQQNRYDEAFEMLQHCLSICPTAPSAQSKLANYYFAMNQKDKAHKALLCAVEDEPDNYWYRQTLSYCAVWLYSPTRAGSSSPLRLGKRVCISSMTSIALSYSRLPW